MKCYACNQSRLRVTHTYDDGEVAIRRRRCEQCGLRVVTEERAPARPAQPAETLRFLLDRTGKRLWIGLGWPECAHELIHLGRMAPGDEALEARFHAHFSAEKIEGRWFRASIETTICRLLEVDPRGYHCAPGETLPREGA